MKLGKRPLLTGCIIKWTGTNSPHMKVVRENQGIHPGDVGLVVTQNVNELYVLIKERFEYFHIGEVVVL